MFSKGFDVGFPWKEYRKKMFSDANEPMQIGVNGGSHKAWSAIPWLPSSFSIHSAMDAQLPKRSQENIFQLLRCEGCTTTVHYT